MRKVFIPLLDQFSFFLIGIDIGFLRVFCKIYEILADNVKDILVCVADFVQFSHNENSEPYLLIKLLVKPDSTKAPMCT